MPTLSPFPRPLPFALALAVAIFFCVPAVAAPHTPPKGSAERTAILNALRPALGSGKHQPLITPSWFKVERGWAFVSGGFVYKNGASLEEKFREGSGTNFSALLQRVGKTWRLQKRLYHGDVVAPEFRREFSTAPVEIFG